ncbi:lasso RiPP family leader peptide-containing protein [Frankia canadensis]|nr:lasso RiPP family leader peptide-containing protein [Frankia canadensis]
MAMYEPPRLAQAGRFSDVTRGRWGWGHDYFHRRFGWGGPGYGGVVGGGPGDGGFVAGGFIV